MSLFRLRENQSKFGAVIDIGSGSVLVSIIHSEKNKKHPTVVWSHREYAPLRNIKAVDESAKAVMTALMNSAMLLDSKGRKALCDYRSNAKITEVQCTISAPWSYTVTRNINYKQDKEFTVSEKLVQDLLDTIEKKIEEELNQNEKLLQLDLEIIANKTLDLATNGYRTKEPYGNKAKSLKVSQSSAVAQKYLLSAIDEFNQKLLHQVDCHKISFILVLYSVARQLLDQICDVCLIDITFEATEIGVVRDGILTYSTHTSFGSFSLVREISVITGIPLGEAFGHLHSENPLVFIEKLPSSQQSDVEILLDKYTDKIAELFYETGDALTVPQRMVVHSDLESEPLFMELIKKAAKKSTLREPEVVGISQSVLDKFFSHMTKDERPRVPKDTALLISAQFFHNQKASDGFEYF